MDTTDLRAGTPTPSTTAAGTADATPVAAAAPTTTAAGARLLATFAAAIFVSAALLFMVQPMFTKMVLPRFGGAPSVWSVAIVFFQGALLVGYGYAHLLTRYAPVRASIAIHVAVMIAACLALPLSIAGGWGRPPPVGEAFWLIGLFAASIGLPFFALAANSPLLQAWFARTDHPAANDPYFLYAGSNVGSFLALMSYPVAVEPLVRLGDQASFWSIGFYLLIVLIVACGALLWRSPERAPAAILAAAPDAAPPSWRDAALWVLLAAVPSGLLVAVTAHISTDVAAVPLLWVLPLALYLLTFIIVFQRRPIIPHWLVVEVQPLFIVGLMAVILFDPEQVKNIVVLVAVHVAVFFVCALVCHGELARRRPPARYLTSFYLWMSAGGVIGGIAAGLIAPQVFNWVAEYPILIALAVLCRPGLVLPDDRRWRYLLLGGVAALAVLLALAIYHPVTLDETTFNWTVGALLTACVLASRLPLVFAALVAFVLIANHSIVERTGAMFVRSFFGVAKVSETTDGQFRLLQHGTTLHGGQRIREADGQPASDPTELLMYYWNGSGIGQTFDAVRARANGPIRYAVIGLGAGSLACRAAPDDTVHFYEIDPAIIRIARDPSLFTFLSTCRPDVPITLGDARLTLAEAPDGAYDLIVVDAFSSDAIPIHLMTREAMAIYLKKLAPNGMIVMHVSNRHLELASVVAGIAAANGLITRIHDSADLDETTNPYKFSGTVAAVVRSDEDFGTLAQAGTWEMQEPDPKQWVWTDDYSNIVGSVLRQMRGE
jgi:spermidine synthase